MCDRITVYKTLLRKKLHQNCKYKCIMDTILEHLGFK